MDARSEELRPGAVVLGLANDVSAWSSSRRLCSRRSFNDYPVELSPFARVTDEDPTIVERFEWNVNDLVRLVEENSDASPDQAEEWRTYLFFLRQHAAPDGSLPAQFDGLVNDVFGDLLR